MTAQGMRSRCKARASLNPPWCGEGPSLGPVPQAVVMGIWFSLQEDKLLSAEGETQGVLFLGWAQRIWLV